MKLLKACFVGLVFFLTLSVFGQMYLTFWTPDPLVYEIQPFTVDKKEYHFGDSQTVSSYRCNRDGQPLVVTTVFRDYYNISTGESFATESAGTGVIQPGCNWGTSFTPNAFPRQMTSGLYVKRGVTEAKGRWKTVFVSWQTERFTYISGKNEF
jgi:hypothetical protein